MICCDDDNTSGGKSSGQVFDVQGKNVTLYPPAKIDLRDAHAIRREMASVYRDMRAGMIDPQDGTRLTYVLDKICRAYETGLLQERLENIERTINHRKEIQK